MPTLCSAGRRYEYVRSAHPQPSTRARAVTLVVSPTDEKQKRPAQSPVGDASALGYKQHADLTLLLPQDAVAADSAPGASVPRLKFVA